MHKIILRSGIALLLMGAVSAMTLMTPTAAMGQFFFMENEDVGKPVKDFTLKVVNGEQVNLHKYIEGSKAIIFFWATWCPHCAREIQELNKQKEDIVQKGIKIVLVDVGESEPVVDKYLKKKNIAIEVFLDEESKVSEDYDLIGVPTFYFVDENGIVADVGHSLPKDLEAVFKKTVNAPHTEHMKVSETDMHKISEIAPAGNVSGGEVQEGAAVDGSGGEAQEGAAAADSSQ